MIYVASIACFILGIVAGFAIACRALSAMQEDFVKMFSHSGKGK